jgi:septal ring factor EnvC (AmiA/AmiB activator)
MYLLMLAKVSTQRLREKSGALSVSSYMSMHLRRAKALRVKLPMLYVGMVVHVHIHNMENATMASKKVKSLKKEIKARKSKISKQEGKLKKLKKALKKAA